jgi:hypothetical protein
MPSLEELGLLIKQKYPGSYDDADPADLARRVKAKFPGSYDQYTEPAPIPGTEKTGLPGVPTMMPNMQMSAAGEDPDAAPKGMLQKGADVFDTFMRAGGEAIGASFRGLGGAVEAGGDYLTRQAQSEGKEGLIGKPIRSIGREIAAFGKDQQRKAAPRANVEKLAGTSFVDDPAVLLKPEWWANLSGSTGASMASMMAPTGAAIGGTQKVIQAAALSKKAAAAATTAAGAGVGAFVETVFDAGNAHQDALANGASKEVAGMIAAETMKREFATTAAFNALGLYNDSIKGVLKRTLFGLMGE